MAEKRGRGRPTVYNIDLDQLENLAAIFCTIPEMAAVFGCSEELLDQPKYYTVIKRGRQRGRMSLRRQMYRKAVTENDTTMMIFLSKQPQILGYKDRFDDNMVFDEKSGKARTVMPTLDQIKSALIKHEVIENAEFRPADSTTSKRKPKSNKKTDPSGS